MCRRPAGRAGVALLTRRSYDRHVSASEYADDEPDYVQEPELDDDPEIEELEPTAPEDMPPDQGDIGRLEFPEDEA